VKVNPYETDRYLHEYLLLHYGKEKDLCRLENMDFALWNCVRFHERIQQECLESIPYSKRTRALDVGCGVGRFTFELSRRVGKAIGIDNSRQFILAAQKIASRGGIDVQVHESGSEFSTRRVSLPRGVRPAKVQFHVGDAQNLGAVAERPFDIVAAINLICRLPSPSVFLRQLPALISPGGQLLIASPYSWLKEYTPPRAWLTASDLKALLQPHFQLVRRCDIPFVIREHRRKYQLVVSEVLTFKRC
jgi:putative 4-mercaptohistidine N1-methyltranferase